jgi:hypothetical protein
MAGSTPLPEHSKRGHWIFVTAMPRSDKLLSRQAPTDET